LLRGGFGCGFAPAGTSGVADCDGFPLLLFFDAHCPPLLDAHVPLSANASGEVATIATLKTRAATNTPAKAMFVLVIKIACISKD
jgi:hypothetical protein